MSNHWQNQSERSNNFMLRLLCWTALLFGRSVLKVLLFVIAGYFLIFASPAKKQSKAFLQRIKKLTGNQKDTTQSNNTVSAREIFQHFYTFAQVSTDRIFFLKGRFNKFNITINNKEAFDQLNNSSRGCILVVSHFGSFEAMRTLAAKNKVKPIHILMDVKHNQKAQSLLSTLNPEMAENIIDSQQSPSALALKLNEIIDQGSMIGIMVDRVAKGEKSANLPFLGDYANFPMSSWLFAAVLQVPILACFARFEGGNNYRVDFQLIASGEKIPRRERNARIHQWQQDYITNLETAVIESPYNWFNFYDFWNHDAADSIELHDDDSVRARTEQ